jgi:hypothetical protein
MPTPWLQELFWALSFLSVVFPQRNYTFLALSLELILRALPKDIKLNLVLISLLTRHFCLRIEGAKFYYTCPSSSLHAFTRHGRFTVKKQREIDIRESDWTIWTIYIYIYSLTPRIRLKERELKYLTIRWYVWNRIVWRPEIFLKL